MVEKGNKKVFFTGDVAWIEKAELEKLPQVNLIVTEASFIKKGGHINRKGDKIYGHTGVPNLIRSLTPYTQKILLDRKSTRLNSSHVASSYAVFCLKKKK